MTGAATPGYWAVIPAGGSGRRLGADRPKQYLRLQRRAVIEHSLLPFCEHPLIKGIVVVVAADDEFWPALALARHARVGQCIRRPRALSFRAEWPQAPGRGRR